MRPLQYDAIYEFIDAGVDLFYQGKHRTLNDVRLANLPKKNVFLFRARNFNTPSELIPALLDARLSSSEEEKFGDFLESLAIYISAMTCDGRKSSAKGIALEFDDDGVRYLVAIKSGYNWGNSSQYQSLEINFRNAIQIQRQANSRLNLRAVLGMCYGSRADVDKGLYIAKMGQSFWTFVSGDAALYLQILDRIGVRAAYQNRSFSAERAQVEGALVEQMRLDYCTPDGLIDWHKVLAFNSGNGENG